MRCAPPAPWAALPPCFRESRNTPTRLPKLAGWLEVNVPESFTVLELPVAHRCKLRTTNMLERINKEIKRRTRVATLFPNEQAALRLVTAVLVEISEEWETNNNYLTMETN